MPKKSQPMRTDLRSLEQIPNIGPAIAADLRRLKIVAPSQLRGRDPYLLYDQLCELDGDRHDPCVLDVFISAVALLDGASGRPWWHDTAQRKQALKARSTRAPATGSSIPTRLARRAFLREGVLLLTAGASLRRAGAAVLADEADDLQVRFGVLTDLHYADKPAVGTRFYRQTPTKLAEANAHFRAHHTAFAIELGDFIDAADSLDVEKGYLRTIHEAFVKLPGKRHFVLGNHCVYSLTKPEFLGIVDQPRSFYSFDEKGMHFVVLDACFRHDMQPYQRRNFQWTDANVPPAQLRWLEKDLGKTKSHTIVFLHQRLDVGGHYGVKNAAAVRAILENAGNVRAVLQGHYHLNDYREIAGIHYVTMAAMVEGSGPEHSAYGLVDVLPDGALRVTGFRVQKSYQFDR